ncbi:MULTISPECIES: phage major capsid protein [Nonomuraea]|uniref:Phage major capsid protein n=1 Tax=Nonomuraea helvata TaxID=37484 RepID=A0ABV5SI43_9ACTN|nr:hypothetical protein [Nonomuraea angiospora]MDX3100451.1 hypothetical protein [Nonomuraea angiospora]
MPVNPPGAPTLAGDLLTIHRLLQSPEQLRRRLRTLDDMRFVADQILTQRWRSSGGAVLFEVSEPIMTSRPVEPVSPGSTYPYAPTADGAAGLSAVQDWGQASRLTDAAIKRRVRGGDELDRVLRKILNTVIAKIDALAIAAVASAVTNTVNADTYGGAWNGTTPNILRTLEAAKAFIADLDMGYEPDTVLLSSEMYAIMVSDDRVNNLRRRETTDNPIYGGDVEMIDDLVVVKAPAARLPAADVWVLDSRQLGGMADEVGADPGYVMAEMGVQVQSERIARANAWDIWARRLTVPVVQEPGAAVRITNTKD